jgi:hypothetical protein
MEMRNPEKHFPKTAKIEQLFNIWQHLDCSSSSSIILMRQFLTVPRSVLFIFANFIQIFTQRKIQI